MTIAASNPAKASAATDAVTPDHPQVDQACPTSKPNTLDPA